MTCFSIEKTFLIALLSLGILLPHTAVRAQEAAAEKSREWQERDKKNEKTDAPIVVELFTATECSACIFADRMLYDAMKRKNVIALSCHIKDLSALHQRDEKDKGDLGARSEGPMDQCVFRQWSYRSGGTNQKDVTLSIPNFVINGYDRVGADSAGAFEQMLNTYGYAYRNKSLEVFMRWKDDDTITVHLPQSPKENAVINASVWIIRYKDLEVERVDSGINKGRVLRFSNIVQDVRHIGKWHGQTRSLDIDVPKPPGGDDRGGYVVLVQEMMGEPVLAAGRLADYPVAGEKKPAAAAPAPARN